jgi:hypothetical protein
MSSLSSPSRTRGRLLQPLHREVSSSPLAAGAGADSTGSSSALRLKRDSGGALSLPAPPDPAAALVSRVLLFQIGPYGGTPQHRPTGLPLSLQRVIQITSAYVCRPQKRASCGCRPQKEPGDPKRTSGLLCWGPGA